jgi:4-amino-4-deoxy-L-arabinose transferase
MSTDEHSPSREPRGDRFRGSPPTYVVVLFLLLFVAPLSVRPIILPDEARYAEIPREMIASGDWVVPRLNGLRYFEKPVMGYWIVAVSISLFGENEFAVRLPSAIATGVSAFMLFFLVQAFVRKGWTPLVALAAFLTFGEVYWVGTFNILDSAFSMFVTGAMVSFFFAHTEPERRKRILFLAGTGVFCGCAFLVKGFLGFVLPVVALAPFVFWERRLGSTLRLSWVPALAALAVCLPWALLIHVREPDFWRFFFWTQHVQRFLSHTADHRQPFWYFFLIFPCAAMPWTFLFPSAFSGLRLGGLKEPLTRFGLCWLIFPFLFFSASSGKLPTYILPCFAPLAVLLAIGFQDSLSERKKLFNAGALSLASLIAAGVVLLMAALFVGYEIFEPYVQPIKLAVAAAGLFMWVLLALFSVREAEGERKTMLFAASPILFLFLSNFLVPDMTLEHKAPGSFLVRHSGRIHPDSVIASDEDPVGAVAWFYRRNDIYIVGGPGELSYGIRFEDSRHRHLEMKQLKELIVQKGGEGRITVIARTKSYARWEKELPKPLFEARNGKGGFVFAQF